MVHGVSLTGDRLCVSHTLSSWQGITTTASLEYSSLTKTSTQRATGQKQNSSFIFFKNKIEWMPTIKLLSLPEPNYSLATYVMGSHYMPDGISYT